MLGSEPNSPVITLPLFTLYGSLQVWIRCAELKERDAPLTQVTSLSAQLNSGPTLQGLFFNLLMNVRFQNYFPTSTKMSCTLRIYHLLIKLLI